MMNLQEIIPEDFSGVISVRRQEEIVFEAGFGYADRANLRPNRIDSKFATASAGKAFVAVAVFALIEAGKLSPDSTIGDLLDFDLKAIDPAITVRQLLNHTSGIPDYFDESVMDDYEELWIDRPSYRFRKSSDLIPLFIDKPMLYPAGERFQYNNTGYVVLGLIIEAQSGLPFDEYLRERIFDRCGMSDTGYFELDKLPANCSFSYIFDPADGRYRTNIFSIEAKGSGAGGAFTTATDVRKFWTALMKGDLITRDSVKLMTSPQIDEGYYGYGLWLIDKTLPSFQGSDPGVDFITSFDREHDLIVTILANMNCDIEGLHMKIRNRILSQASEFFLT